MVVGERLCVCEFERGEPRDDQVVIHALPCVPRGMDMHLTSAVQRAPRGQSH